MKAKSLKALLTLTELLEELHVHCGFCLASATKTVNETTDKLIINTTITTVLIDYPFDTTAA